jgi:hypothetical protein
MTRARVRDSQLRRRLLRGDSPAPGAEARRPKLGTRCVETRIATARRLGAPAREGSPPPAVVPSAAYYTCRSLAHCAAGAPDASRCR